MFYYPCKILAMAAGRFPCLVMLKRVFGNPSDILPKATPHARPKSSKKEEDDCIRNTTAVCGKEANVILDSLV